MDHKVWHNVNVGAGDWLCYVIDKYLSRLEGCVAITCNTTFRDSCQVKPHNANLRVCVQVFPSFIKDVIWQTTVMTVSSIHL